jgi:hypothetical protein
MRHLIAQVSVSLLLPSQLPVRACTRLGGRMGTHLSHVDVGTVHSRSSELVGQPQGLGGPGAGVQNPEPSWRLRVTVCPCPPQGGLSKSAPLDHVDCLCVGVSQEHSYPPPSLVSVPACHVCATLFVRLCLGDRFHSTNSASRIIAGAVGQLSLM